jgi:hypothetical protein
MDEQPDEEGQWAKVRCACGGTIFQPAKENRWEPEAVQSYVCVKCGTVCLRVT